MQHIYVYNFGVEQKKWCSTCNRGNSQFGAIEYDDVGLELWLGEKYQGKKWIIQTKNYSTFVILVTGVVLWGWGMGSQLQVKIKDNLSYTSGHLVRSTVLKINIGSVFTFLRQIVLIAVTLLNIINDNFLNSVLFSNKSLFKNNFGFFVSLIVFGSQLIHPSKLTVTPFTRNVSNPMSSC